MGQILSDNFPRVKTKIDSPLYEFSQIKQSGAYPTDIDHINYITSQPIIKIEGDQSDYDYTHGIVYMLQLR